MVAELGVIDPWSEGFLIDLVRTFRLELEGLLAARRRPLSEVLKDPELLGVRESGWRCAPTPADLVDRRVEITGPGVEAKMVIGALNSGAQGYMVDGEDSLCPTWSNVIATHRNLYGAVRRTLTVDREGTKVGVCARPAVLHYRPRGLHMVESNFRVDAIAAPAALFDAGLFLYWNAVELVKRGSGPYLYLPKLESPAEAAWWSRVAGWCESRLGLAAGTIRFTVLVETLPLLLRLETVVWELRDRLTGLNVGRWDYIFSCIKSLRDDPGYVLPDRASLHMGAPPLAEYARWVVNVAHRRGCHAIGGMAAQVPNRRDEAATARAYEAVDADKSREVALGHDGTWVAHPDLVHVARAAFDRVLQGRVEQRWRVPGNSVLNVGLVTQPVVGSVTVGGVCEAARSAVVYLDAWLRGNGCVAMAGKMEDAATAEISRALLWQWGRWKVEIEGGGYATEEWIVGVLKGEAAALAAAGAEPLPITVKLLVDVVSIPNPPDFITTVAYPHLSHHR